MNLDVFGTLNYEEYSCPFIRYINFERGGGGGIFKRSIIDVRKKKRFTTLTNKY